MISKLFVVTYLILHYTINRATAISYKDYCFYDGNLPCVTECARSKECGILDEILERLTDRDRFLILHLHNEIRNAYAGGNLPGYSSKVKDINVLSYDMELEFFAQCFAKQCNPKKPRNQKSILGVPIGFTFTDVSTQAIINRIEYRFFNQSLLKMIQPSLYISPLEKYPSVFKPSPSTEDFFQIIWPTTKYVGCAIIRTFMRNGAYNTAFTCAYAPAGNTPGFEFRLDTAAERSSRYNRKLNEDYNHLIGDIRPINRSEFIAPYVNSAPVEQEGTAFFVMLQLVLLLNNL